MGTLALSFAGRVSYTALMCHSWSCSTCRKVRAAQLLDQLRRGMESRPELNRILVTLTLDPKRFGAVPTGTAHWDQQGNRTARHKAIRHTTLWSGPTPEVFQDAAAAMSDEWNKLNDRLGRKAKRAKVARHGYFRVIELHRNGWPHYHVVIEHPSWTAADVQTQLAGWGLGIADARDVSLDDAVGEVAPYLVSAESKGKGSKAYQFAASALPVGFRLYSSSKGFLAVPAAPDELPERVLAVKGHFYSHHVAARDYGADSRIVLNPPPDESSRPHRPPGTAATTGDGSVLYFLSLLAYPDAEPLHLTPDDLAQLPF